MKKQIYIILGLTTFALFSFKSMRTTDISHSICQLSISTLNDSTFVINNNSNPYTIRNHIISGNPIVVENSDTIQITGNNYSVLVLVTDTNNCVAQELVNKF